MDQKHLADSVKSELPLVSVGVACYNQAKYVVSTLDSIINQAYGNMELIIVDDCSKDDSVQIIQDWIDRNDIDCIFIKHEVNKGVCKTVNDIVVNAKGKYLSFTAADDLMVEGKLKVQVDLLEKAASDVGFVYSDAYLIDSDGKEYFGRFIQWHRHFFVVPQGDIFKELLEDNFIPIMTVLWKRECFDVCGLFDENLLYDDYDMLLRVSFKYKVIFSDFIAAKYRVHATNLHKSLQNVKAMESNFRMFYKHLGVRDKMYDAIVKEKLFNYLLRMYDLGSSNVKEYFDKYHAYFKDNSAMKIALASGLSYYHLAKVQRVLKKVGIN